MKTTRQRYHFCAKLPLELIMFHIHLLSHSRDEPEIGSQGVKGLIGFWKHCHWALLCCSQSSWALSAGIGHSHPNYSAISQGLECLSQNCSGMLIV